jgi:hypothetical protein
MRPLLAAAALVAALGAAGPARALAPTDPISLVEQTDGVTHSRDTTVAIFCRKEACAGALKLTVGRLKIGSASFSIAPKTTAHVPVRITRAGFALIKGAKKRKLKTTLTVTMASGQVLTHVITLRA